MLDLEHIYDYGLIVPEGTDVKDFTPELAALIQSFKAEFPSSRVFGTQPFNGKQIVYVRLQHSFTTQQLNDLFTLHNLQWEVIAIRSAYKILHFLDSTDEYGNTTYRYTYDEPLPIDKAKVIPFVPGATLDTPLTVPVYAGTDPLHL